MCTRECDTKCKCIVHCTFAPSDFSPDCGEPDYSGPVKRGGGRLYLDFHTQPLKPIHDLEQEVRLSFKGELTLSFFPVTTGKQAVLLHIIIMD